jgi:hypothetical protein
MLIWLNVAGWTFESSYKLVKTLADKIISAFPLP